MNQPEAEGTAGRSGAQGLTGKKAIILRTEQKVKSEGTF